MDIKTVADLAKLADVCRKKGIKQLKVSPEGVEIQLGDRPQKKQRLSTKDEIKDAIPSDEEMLFWSSAGIPGSAN